MTTQADDIKAQINKIFDDLYVIAHLSQAHVYTLMTDMGLNAHQIYVLWDSQLRVCRNESQSNVLTIYALSMHE